jgi:signal transduction histidine kinase/CheY-like chemotaxis protein
MASATDKPRTEGPFLVRYGLAVGVVVVTFFVNRMVPAGLFPSAMFIAAIMAAAHFGGTGPAILAFFIAGAFLDYFWIPPFNSFSMDPDTIPSLSQVIIPSVVGCWFIERRKRAERLLQSETIAATRLQGDLSASELGQVFLDFIAPEIGAPVAALYTVDPDGSAHRSVGYALDLAKARPSFAPGEGVVGQAIRSKRTTIVEATPDYLEVSSALGRRKPSCVVVLPASDGEQTQAALEVGLYQRADPVTLELLERVAKPLAIAVRTAAYRENLKRLLDETRRQAEELKAHEEELRTVNEELEERGRVMAEAHRRLEEQQSEMEQTNEALQRQARLLEERNDELGRAHEMIRLKSESADRANQAKSEFLANMSHELRTPLNSSLILAKLLMENADGNLTPQQIRFADSIYAAGNDLLAMIDDILDLAKIEANQIDLHVEELPLARVREETVRVFDPIAVERSLAFEIDVHRTAPPSLATDAKRLSQILKNLLSNAFKFTAQGKVSLAIDGEGDAVRFTVSDTGIGIASEQLAVIFEPFRQADGTTSRKYGGTGLGLSISRDLARMLGGDIDVRSVVGAGSVFTLRLPRVQTTPAVRRAEHERQGPRRGPAPAGAPTPRPSAAPAAPTDVDVPRPSAPAHDRSRRLLVVEDDPRFAEIVADLAREVRFEPFVATSAEEAIEMATRTPPDGIVLDMKLPDHSGLSVLDRLKRDSRTRHIPVHVISFTDETRAALEMGAVGYLLKPAPREQIKAALAKLEAKFERAPRRLLVVEDDPAQRDAICDLLSADGVEIIAVGTVKEALERIRTTSLDCVVTDLALPDASGYDLLETMAQDDAYTFPSVVVYTGRSLSAEEEQRLRRYSQSIIVKGARSPERLLDEVTLFLHQLESSLSPDRRRMLQKARHREAVFEDRNVLVVEDDVRNVFALTSALEPKGMRVTIARNGREALVAIESGPVDLVLMDIMMPEMDGLEAMRTIRRQPRWAKLPIIALTAKAMPDDQERCLQAGANDYISKPLDVEMLLSLLRVWMPR